MKAIFAGLDSTEGNAEASEAADAIASLSVKPEEGKEWEYPVHYLYSEWKLFFWLGIKSVLIYKINMKNITYYKFLELIDNFFWLGIK